MSERGAFILADKKMNPRAPMRSGREVGEKACGSGRKGEGETEGGRMPKRLSEEEEGGKEGRMLKGPAGGVDEGKGREEPNREAERARGSEGNLRIGS